MNFWKRWLKRLPISIRTPSHRGERKRTILQLETLEDRLAPTVATSPFTPGDLAVVQVGNGTAFADSGAAVFIDEYTPSGVFVQQIALPTTSVSGGNQALVLGNSTNEGELNLSTDGRALLLTGYDTTVGGGGTTIENSTSASINRTIAEISAAGAVNTTTALTDFASAGDPRAVAGSDATGFWLAGQDGTTGAVRYISTLGSATTTSTNLTGTANKNARDVEIWNGQLYFTQNKVTSAPIIEGLNTSGTTGLQTPTAAFNAGVGPTVITPLPGTGTTNLSTPGSNAKTGGFFFAKLGSGANFTINGADSGYDTLYVADGDTHTGTNSSPGLTKYSWTGTSWVINGTIGSSTLSFEGLTGSVNGTTVTLYATVVNPTSGTDGIVSITDNSGFNATITNNGSTTPTTIVTAAPTNTAFRGIAFAPTAAALSITGLATAVVTSGGPAVNISGTSAAFADTLAGSQLNNSTLSVSITANGDSAHDLLAITNQGTAAGQIGASGGNVTYAYTGGIPTTIGTYTGGTGGASLVITFNSNATAVAIQALIQQISFQTNSSSSTARTVQFTFTPSAGNGSPVSASETVNVQLFTPTINAGSAITLGENHAAYTTTLTGINDGESDGNTNVTSVAASVTGGTASIFASSPVVTGYNSTAGTATLGFTLSSGLTGVGSATITVTVTNNLNNTATATYTVTVNAVTVTSTGAQVLAGKSAIITAAELTTSETGVTAANIQYTLTANPPASAGTIDKTNAPLGQGSTFTQADINNGLISYVSTGSTPTTDSVAFSIADLTNGGALTGQTFSVTVITGIIAEWTFPTVVAAPDNSPAPTLGTGTATTLGMTNSLTNANGTGNTASDDVLSTSGTANAGFTENLWRIRGTPNNGWANSAPQYSQGIELDTSTVGYANIVFSFDWYSTTQGIRDLQVQYNTGSGWVNYSSGENAAGTFIATSNDYFNALLSPLSPTIRIDLSGISAANNNLNLGIRLVSAYDSTGNFPNSYASAASTPNNIIEYNNSSGNWRFGNLIFAAGTTTTTKVAASPAGSQNPNANVTFTATVTPTAGVQFPTGTITFYDGKNQIGTTQPVTQVGASNVGTASITLNNLPPGVHGDITAVYTPTNGNGFIASGPSMNVIVGDPADNPISYTINAPQATGVDISPIVNQSFTGVVATFSDGTITNPNGFSATITWASGQTSQGVIKFTGTKQETDITGAIVNVSLFTVTGTHTYATAGSFPISVLITDPNSNTATVNLTARVAYPPLKVSEVMTINGTAGTTISNQTVATFTDPGLVANLVALGINDPTTQFATTINWGDGSSNAGVVAYNAGTGVFSVNGTHAYAQAGVFPMSISVTPLTVSVERIDSSDPTNLNEVGDEINNGITDSPSADFVDQFVIGAANQAASLYTFSLPTVATAGGNEALTNSSYSVSEGELTLSTNGQYLVMGGYNLTVSLWGPQQTFSPASVINRVIGTIDGQGNINTKTALTDTYTGDNFRGVVSTDGTQFWTSGHSGDSSDFVHYAQLGASTSTILTGPSGASNINTVEIFNGQLYEGVRSTSGALAGIYQIGTGLPTTAGQAQTLFIQVPQSNPLDTTSSSKPMSPFGFYMTALSDGNPTINGVNVAYVADAEMGIARYDYTNTGWQFSYYINSTGSFLNSAYTVDSNGNITATGSPANADPSKAGGVRELTGRIVNGQVQLFAVTGFGIGSQPNPGESLISVTDTGANAGFTTLATDTGASVLTGVAFTPTQTVTSQARVAVHPTLSAATDTYTTGENAPLTKNAANGILSNDTGSPITIVSPLTTGTPQTSLPTGYVAQSGTQTPTSYAQPFTTTTAQGGTVTVNPDGSFNYVPPSATFTGSDSFNYTITDAVQDYKTDLPILGTFNNVPLTAGGYGSSLYPVPGTTDEFYGLEDRGPNATAANGNIVEPTPNYDPAIGKFQFVNGQAILLQYIPLKDAAGNPYSGRVNSANPTGETLVDLNGNVQAQDPNGYDSEGLVAMPDGTFWVSDEYGPFITHFDATGKQIARLSPLDGTLPVELQNRLPNRGMEGLTITPDGTMLVGMMQSALNEPDNLAVDPKKIDITRLITYQLVATPGNPVGTVHEYLYQLDNPVTNKTANSELTALDDTHFLVDERDGNEPGVPGTPYYKKLWEVDITGATDVGPNSPLIGTTASGGAVAYDTSATHLGLTIGGKSLEKVLGTQNTAAALATLTSDGITPVNKGTTPYLDVGALITTLDPTGHFFAHDKIEGVAVVNNGTQIVISNDSDFNVGGVNGLGAGNTAPYQLISKSTLNNAGVADDGEYLVVNLTRLPAATSSATVNINVVDVTSPKGLIAAAPGYDMPTFAWNPVTGADHYYLAVVDDTTGMNVINVPSVQGTTFATTQSLALTPGHKFTWYIAAYNASGTAITPFVGHDFTLAALAAPTNITPTGTIPALDGVPNFAWTGSPGADHYYLYVVDNNTGKAVINQPTVNGTSFVPVGVPPLTPGHSYTIALWAVSTNGVVFSLGLQNFSMAPLAAPTNITPTGTIPAAAGFDRPTFNWTASSGADYYALVVTDNNTGLQPIAVAKITGTSYVTTNAQPLTPGHSFTVQLWAVSANGLSFTMGTQTFALAALAAPTITATSGSVPAAVGYDKPTFTWNASPGADYYAIVVTDNNTGLQPIAVAKVTGTSYVTTAAQALTPGHSFTTQVWAVSFNGLGFTQGTRNFSLAPVTAPTGVGPSGVIAPTAGYDRPNFTWTPTGADHYALVVTDNNAGTQPIAIASITGASYQTTAAQALTPGHSFTTQLWAVSANGLAFALTTQTFSLAALAGPPTSLTPGGTIAASPPSFNWSAVVGADHYYLYVVDNTTGMAVINNPMVTTNSFSPTAPLTKGHQYTWFVAAVSTNGLYMIWSASQTFTITPAI